MICADVISKKPRLLTIRKIMSDSKYFYGKENIPITLIGGSGRSGTTIFRRLFETHPDVCCIQEWRIPVDPGGLVDFFSGITETWTPLIFDARYRELARIISKTGNKNYLTKIYRSFFHKFPFYKFTDFNFDIAYGAVDLSTFSPRYESLAKELLQELQKFKYQASWTGKEWMSCRELVYAYPFERHQLAILLGEFFRAVASDCTRTRGGKFFLDKNTWYPLVFDKFHELVPEAKLVVINRDPRDVICSFTEQRWAPKELTKAAQYYRGIMDRWYMVKDQLPRDCYIEIRYEDLVAAPVDVLRTVCEFSGLPMPKEPYGLNNFAVGRWRKQLSKSQLESIAPYVIKELGVNWGI